MWTTPSIIKTFLLVIFTYKCFLVEFWSVLFLTFNYMMMIMLIEHIRLQVAWERTSWILLYLRQSHEFEHIWFVQHD
jgi:hypothetical protein